MVTQLGEQRDGPGGTLTLIEAEDKVIAGDCGMGIDNERGSSGNYYPVLTEKAYGNVDLILLTHHHLDHSGALPLIAKMNPKAVIMMTDPCMAGAYIMIKDALKIAEQEAKKIRRQGGNPEPFIYDAINVGSLFRRIQPITKPGWHSIWPGWEIGFYSSGHTRGATMIFIVTPGKKAYWITGDVCSHDQPLVKGVMLPPEEFFGNRLKGKSVVMITETTYGNRVLDKSMPEIQKEVKALVKEAIKRQEQILFPSFADRGPSLLKLLTDGGIACHIDGMAARFCEVYAKRTWCDQDINLEVEKLVAEKLAVLYKQFDRSASQEERQAEEVHRENTALGSCCGIQNSPIISSSAMLEQGRSVGYAEKILPNRKGRVIFSGYMFPGTTGEQILKVKRGTNIKLRTWDAKQRQEVVKPIPVSCEVSHFSLSGHDPADRLVERVARFHEKICPVEAVIGHHGDQENYAGFEQRVNALNLGIPVLHGAHLKELPV